MAKKTTSILKKVDNQVSQTFKKPYPNISTTEFFTGKSLNGLHPNTLIIKADGRLKEIGKVKIGEKVLGSNGVAKVIDIKTNIAQGFEVQQFKGVRFIAAQDQVVHFKVSKNESGRKNGDDALISIKEFLEQSKRVKNDLKIYKPQICLEEKALVIEPYFFGLWLGDGDKDTNYITNTDEKIIAYLNEYAKRLGLKLSQYKHPERCGRYKISGGYTGNKGYSLQSKLRSMGVLGNKDIPSEFLMNSSENQLELLAGIVDSDGHNCKSGKCYEVTQTNESLARKIKLLADLLGFRTSMSRKKTSIKPNAIMPYGFYGIAYRVIISGNVGIIPVKIQRKIVPEYTGNKSWKVSGVKSIEPLEGRQPFVSLELDSSDCLFLKDMTAVFDNVF
jgi:replicative DNA helicase